MKKSALTRSTLVKIGVPALLIPGLILAASLGWNWQKSLPQNQNYSQNRQIFPQTALVKDVHDGDTFTAESGLNFRLLGINAPESGEPYYYLARDKTRRLILGKKVELEYEPGYQSDPYGRLLVYVWVGEKTGRRLVNQSLAAEGLAKVVLNPKHRELKYQDKLLEAQNTAQKQKLGLWSTPSP